MPVPLLRFPALARARACWRSLNVWIKFFAWMAFIAALVGAFAGGILGSAARVGNISSLIEDGALNRTGISLIGHVYNTDIPNRQVTISWLIVGCGALRLSYTSSYGVPNCGRLNTAADFYVDGSSEPNGSYDPLLHPTRKGVAGITYMQALNQFQTQHLLELSAWRGLDQQYAYPFDTYFLHANFVAISPETNESLPLLDVSPVDSNSNFQPYRVGHEYTTVRTKEEDGTIKEWPGVYMRMTFFRTVLTQVFVMSLFIVNWCLTGVVVFITVVAVDGITVSESIMLLPLSVFVTIPALRALWVGAPAFGLLLDSSGLFLQMVVVSICSIFIVVKVGLVSTIYKVRHPVTHEGPLPTSIDGDWKETDQLTGNRGESSELMHKQI